MNARGTIAIGRPRTEPIIVFAGILLLLPAVVLAALFARPAAKLPAIPTIVPLPLSSYPRFNYRTLTPTTVPAPPPGPYVALTDNAVAEAIFASPAAEKLDLLLREASLRGKTSTIPITQAVAADDPIGRLVKAGLVRQADPNQDWPLPWAHFIESLENTRYVNWVQWKQYLYNGVRVDATFRDSLQFGQDIPFAYKSVIRVSPELAEHLQCRVISLSVGDVFSDDVLRYGVDPANEFRSRSTYQLNLPEAAWNHIKLGQQMIRLTILVSRFGPSFQDTRNDWMIHIARPIEVVPAQSEQFHYTAGLDEEVARNIHCDADSLTWENGKIHVKVTCDHAPTDLYVDVGISAVNSKAGFGMGKAYWRKGEGGTRESSVRWDQFAPDIGKPFVVDLVGTPGNARVTFEKGQWWAGNVRIFDITLVDPTVVENMPRPTPETKVLRPSSRGVDEFASVSPATLPNKSESP